MKKIFVMMAACAIACVASAAQDFVVLTATGITTGDTADVVSSGTVFGRIDRVYINAEVNTNDYTLNVSLTATDAYSGEVRTFIPAQVLGTGTNLSVMPRVPSVKTTDGTATSEYEPFLLHDDTIKLNVHSASESNRNVKAYIYYNR